MAAFIEMPTLEERSDTQAMRDLLHAVGRAQSRSGIAVTLPRLARNLGFSPGQVASLINAAENCGWIEMDMTAIKRVTDVRLTNAGWNHIGGKPIWTFKDSAA